MSPSLSLSRAAHAGVSIGILLLAFFFAASLIAGFLAQFSARLSALKARADSVAELTVRLDGARAEIRERLEAIGAAPRDLEAVASPQTAKALVSSACAAFAQSIKAACTMEETPLSATLALHQARLTARGSAPQIVFAMTIAIAPPLRIAKLTMKPGGDDSSVEISALIEVAGARSGEPAS